MDAKSFYQALTDYHGGQNEPLNETVAVLSYEVGRMMEHAMYAHWQPDNHTVRVGFLKSELMDAIAQLVLICEAVDADFDEMKELGIEKAMERFTHKEVKR